MYVIDKNRTAIINTEHMTSMHIGGDRTSIKVNFVNGSGCQLGNYCTSQEAEIALGMVMQQIAKDGVFYMPVDEAVRNALTSQRLEKPHHVSGKKPKGHGGS